MSAISRSMEATTPGAAGAVDRARRSLPNGWWGMAILIATEATTLGVMIAAYFYLRAQSLHWPPPGIEKPSVAYPLVLTGILVSTSVPMWLAVRLARRGLIGPVRLLIGGALAVQGTYLGLQISEFLSDVDKVHATASSYGSIYLTILATHHAHVLVGILLSTGLLARLLRGLTNYRLVGLRAVALYWHFVNVMAVAVVLTQLYPSL